MGLLDLLEKVEGPVQQSAEGGNQMDPTQGLWCSSCLGKSCFLLRNLKTNYLDLQGTQNNSPYALYFQGTYHYFGHFGGPVTFESLGRTLNPSQPRPPRRATLPRSCFASRVSSLGRPSSLLVDPGGLRKGLQYKCVYIYISIYIYLYTYIIYKHMISFEVYLRYKML